MDFLSQGETWATGLPLLITETLLLCAVFFGWGSLAARAAGYSGDAHSLNIFELGILGLSAIYVAGVGLSLVTAFTPAVSNAVVVLGLAGGLYTIVRRRVRVRGLLLEAVLLALLAAYFTGGVALTSLHYDTGLYHLQVIRWFQTDALPLGLANLHIRFGYNSAWFVIGSLLGNSQWIPDGTFLMNGVASILFSGALIVLVSNRYREGRMTFAALLAGVSVITYFGSAFHSLFGWMGLAPSTDIPAALLTIYVAVLMATVLEDAAGVERPKTAPDPRIFLAAVAACLTVAIKLSQFPTALLVILVALRLQLPRSAAWKRTLSVSLAGMVLVSGGWGLHSAMLSGCALFPYGISCVGWIPWSADPALADGLANALKMWARAPGLSADQVPGGWDWIPLWIEFMWPDRTIVKWVLYVSALVAALAVLFGLTTLRRGGRPVASTGFAWCLGLGAVGVVLCAVTAPDPRYYLGYFFLVPGSLVARMYTGPWGRSAVLAKRLLVVTAGILLIVLSARSMKARFTVSHLDRPCCEWRRLPAVRYQTQSTDSGFTVKTPAQGDQCWDLEVPCTPGNFYRSDLRKERLLGRSAYIR